MCLGHICQHRRHYPVLQTEAQEEGCNGKLMFYKGTLLAFISNTKMRRRLALYSYFCFPPLGFVLFAVQDEDSVTSCLKSQC